MNQLSLNNVYLSPEDPIEQLNLTNRSFNALTRAGIRTVGEVLQLVESNRLQTLRNLGRKSILEIKHKLAQVETLNNSATETDTEAVLSQDDIFLALEDPIEQLDLTPRALNAFARANIQTVGQVLQLVESDRLWAIRGLGRKSISQIKDELAQAKILHHSEVEANTDVTSNQNNLFLSREDPIKKLNLSSHSFNTLTRISIQTVGEVVQLIESVRLKTIRELGTKCILEITTILPRVKILNGTEVESWSSSEVWSQLIGKLVNDAEAESIIKKDDIPRRVVREQSQLVRKQLSKGLLHEEAIIAEKSIKAWLAEAETLETNRVYEVLAVILGSSVNVCEEIEFFLNQMPGQYRTTVLLSMYGFEAKTLAQTGKELGISRERVRQIRIELKDKATSISNLKAKPVLHRMQSALLIAGDLGLDITYEQWAQRIRSSGLVGDWTSQEFVSADTVEAMIAIYNLLADCELRWLQMPQNLQYTVQLATEGKTNVPAKTPHAIDTLSDEVRRLINRHTKFSGSVHTRWLSQEIDMELEAVTDILQGLGYEALSRDWFTPHQISYSDVFHRCLRQMFQYCGRLTIDDICAGMRHGISRSGSSVPEYLADKGIDRSVFPVPPPEVMGEILRTGGYQFDDELYYWNGTCNEKLSKGEAIIMNCLEQIGPVLHHSELVHAFIASNMSFPLLHATLNYSPLFERIESGLYKLRGKEITYQDIERAKAAGEKQPLRPEVEYDTDGNIIVSVTLSAIAVGSGTILSERFPDLSGAAWKCYVNGEKSGELNAVENEFRRLKKSFELLNCQPGERVKFTFNTWERRVEIEREAGGAKG